MISVRIKWTKVSKCKKGKITIFLIIEKIAEKQKQRKICPTKSEFQWKRRDKVVYLDKQCKDFEDKNQSERTRNFLKKIIEIKRSSFVKIGSIKASKSKEKENIKKYGMNAEELTFF